MLKKSFLPAFLALFLVCAATVATSFADELDKELGRDLRQSRTIVLRAAAKLKAGDPPAPEISSLKSMAESIRAARLLDLERFKAGGEKAATLGVKAVERHETVSSGFIRALEEYLALIDALPPDDTISQATLDSLRDLLDRIIKPRQTDHQIQTTQSLNVHQCPF